MKRFLISILMIIPSVALSAQTGSKSSVCSFNIVKEVKPPLLSVDPSSIRFEDISSNNAIDAGENSSISFTVSNDGYGEAYNCVARFIDILI